MPDQTIENPTVLIVEDERRLADHYADCLDDDYTVVTAYGGEEGVERLRSDVDVAVVERRMSLVSGNEVLASIQDGDVDCRVAFLVDDVPESDVVDTGIDDYLVRPIDCETLTEVVDRLVAIDEYTDVLEQLTTKKLRRNVLEVEDEEGTAPVETEDGPASDDLDRDIQRLESRIAALESELDLEDIDVGL